MADRIEAIYENGRLRLLSPVDLTEGQHVLIDIEPVYEQQVLKAALSDLLAHWPDTSDDGDAHLEQRIQEIDDAFQGQPPLSQLIIEDRGDE